MKPHDICTTLLLPIWVSPSRPTFSLQINFKFCEVKLERLSIITFHQNVMTAKKTIFYIKIVPIWDTIS